MNTDFLQGMRSSVPVVVGSAPFGALFGALAVDNGFSVSDAVLMSASVYAGASQLVGLDLFGKNIQPWLVVLSIFAVNFRHILYSASMAPYIKHFSGVQKAFAFFLLVDPQYAETEKRHEKGLPVSFSWYLGLGLSVYVPWVAVSALGAFFGKMIGDPHALGLDILLPAYFMGLVLGFRQRSHWLPVVVASSLVSIVAMHFVGSPWHISIGALAGLVLAACMPVTSDTLEGEGAKP
ncbi:AzlC family ABC transporter permease [Rhizobium sp. CFBP 8762]|uniref:AzlC family ABC transporter permease n=1 Tax=Rhizobium sp. CFBP 8762 TaxID=2775279 RepID=UPI00177E5056|nr:AzlC family ABC transporter permease [Rhizobium sp. CFBP 8762]MBD8554805.1 AzlC family ABC transporter permease [Rhizobium sp. CFBP 8762]